VLAAALLGGEAANSMPLLIVSAVTAFVVGHLVRGRRPAPAPEGAAA
jgi:hypothetical protein